MGIQSGEASLFLVYPSLTMTACMGKQSGQAELFLTAACFAKGSSSFIAIVIAACTGKPGNCTDA